MTAKHWHHRC